MIINRIRKKENFLRYLHTMAHLQDPFRQSTVRKKLLALHVLIAFLCAPFSQIFAQDDLNVHGVVSHAMTSSKLDAVKVTVKKDGTVHNTSTTRANGKYEFYLASSSRYEFLFEKEGYVTRSIIIDSKGIPQDVIGAGIIMPTDMTMFEITEAMAGADLSVFDQPIGVAKYDPTQEDLVWDFAHTTRVKSEINSFIRDIEKKQKELDKEASAADKEKEANEAKFAQFVKDGDGHMSKSNYQDAVGSYKSALIIKPGNAAVEAKLGDAETKWNSQKAKEKLDSDYTAALDAADGFMRTEEFPKALEKFEAALALKPNEKYPKDKIEETKKIIADREANKANQAKFNGFMTAGDAAFAEKNYTEAVKAYEDALKVIPDNGEAQTKLKNSKDAIANAEQLAAVQAEYDALIKSADTKFNAKDYEPAKKDYQAALALKKDEPHPAKRIDEIEVKVQELAQAAEQQIAFDKAISEGNADRDKQAYEDAIVHYQEALNIISNDPNAKAKLKETQDLYAEKQAEADKDARYTALISDADSEFKSEAYASAKEKYEEARTIKPDETHPLDQLNKIKGLLAAKEEAEAAQNAYDQAMTSGQNAVGAKDFPKAINEYEKAILAKPGDKNATAALDDAKSQKIAYESQVATEQQYTDLLAKADKKFANGELSEAKADYQAASKLKPAEKYPTDQLTLIETAVAQQAADKEAAEEQAALQARFDAEVAKGDAAVAKNELTAAVKAYEDALTIIPDEQAVTKKLNNARSGLSAAESAAALEKEYNDLIAIADKQFQEENLTAARETYSQAVNLKADETYPKDRLSLIDEQIAEKEKAAANAEQAAKIESANALVLEGDQARKSKKFDQAIAKYEQALAILPERKDVEQKITDTVSEQLAAMESEATQEAYDAAIANADKAFDKSNWKDARKAYSDALAIKANESYPQERITDIDAKLQAIADAEAAAEKERILVEFNKKIKDGDAQFGKNRMENALSEYEDALALIPDSELALEKIAEVNIAIGAIEEASAEQNAYRDAITEADRLFADDALEMARLGYLDAEEIMPNEKYPAKKISEIDFLIEKRRLEDAASSVLALDREYNEAIRIADELLRKLEYENSISAYQDALEIKSEERYPRSQIEKAQLLIAEREENEKERLRREAQELEAQNKAKKKKESYQTVSRTSEEQAEAFMRDAREAQEKERYERIKKQKAFNQTKIQDFEDQAKDTRTNNYETIQSYADADEQFKEGITRYETRVKNSQRYKKTLLENRDRQVETDLIRDKDAYREISRQMEDYATAQKERQDAHTERSAQQRDENRAAQEKREQWVKESYENRLEENKRIQQSAAKLYDRNQAAEELRATRSERILEDAKEIRKVQQVQEKENIEAIRERSTQLKETQETNADRMQQRSDEKVESSARAAELEREKYTTDLQARSALADEQRQKNANELASAQAGAKEYTDYYRTELALEYPQGVTEESSTMGNKVIITRIVVKGNRGDEYKKVLDKAGNYYFKNGQSISEQTWNRETLDAFYSKD